MGCRKTVTEMKLAANRLNAKRSTGPRTERGKNTSRFNALKTGLFAEQVVIPFDGEGFRDDGPRKQFARLLRSLQEEYKPEGLSEALCVVDLAECRWKLRRLSRSERGLVLATTSMNSSVAIDNFVNRLNSKISFLERLLKVIETTRSESPKMCEASVPLLYMMLTKAKISLGTENESSPGGATLDQFVVSLQQAKDNLTRSFSALIGERWKADYDAARVLPREEDMDQLLRYDKALQKKYDWALQKLLESQERRRKAQAPVSLQGPSDQ